MGIRTALAKGRGQRSRAGLGLLGPGGQSRWLGGGGLSLRAECVRGAWTQPSGPLEDLWCGPGPCGSGHCSPIGAAVPTLCRLYSLCLGQCSMCVEYQGVCVWQQVTAEGCVSGRSWVLASSLPREACSATNSVEGEICDLSPPRQTLGLLCQSGGVAGGPTCTLMGECA